MKREAVKYIRDKAKAKYFKGDHCEICRTQKDLEFHHYKSVARLLDQWLKKNRNYTEDDVLEFRDQFIEDNKFDMYENTVTLCKKHHKLLHSIYGVEPMLGTAEKQRNWVMIQKGKHETI